MTQPKYTPPELAGPNDRYLPAPKNGAICPISGFSHARFYQKVLNGPGRTHVRVVDLKEAGQIRGTRFYHAGDLLAWLNSLATKQCPQQAGTTVHSDASVAL